MEPAKRGVRRATQTPVADNLQAMAKVASKLKKTAAKSKPSAPGRAKTAAPAGARKALNKAVVNKPAADTTKSGKWVYTFGDGKAEGKASMRDLLGGKGANLAEMANLGLP